MSLNISIINTPAVQVSFQEAAGIGKLVIASSIQAGGGNVAGFVSGKLTGEVDVSAIQLADAGLQVLAAKFPQYAAEIALLKSGLDAEVASL